MIGNTRAVDLVVLALVPAALVLVYALPASVTDSWRLAVLDPTLRAALLSHFVHGSPSHLVTNVAGYTLLAPLTYVLCLSAGRRREFFGVIVALLFGLPVVLSGLNLAVPRPSIVYGFSGVVMALLGFLALATGWHVEKRFDAVPDGRFAPVGFFLGTGVISAIGAPITSLSLVAFGLAVVGGAAYLGSATATGGGVGRLVSRRDLAEPWRVELAAAGFLLVAIFPITAFPYEPASIGVVPNVYEHALGYCLGFVGPYAVSTVVDHPGIGHDASMDWLHPVRIRS